MRGLLFAWLSALPRNRSIKICLASDIKRLQRLWDMDKSEIQVLKNTCDKKFYEGVLDNNIRELAKKAYDKVLNLDIKVITQSDSEYPALLKATVDAPAVLFYKGDIAKCKKSIAIIGSRKATSYGIRAARDIAEALAAKGACVVSGLARGIDSVAHMGALKVQGNTCAVIGSGHDVVYPPENDTLINEIFENGVVVSEYIPGTLPMAHNFPARNRIISGLSQGLVVVEAGKESGTLITVDFALEQGRDVFAVPGNIYSSRSDGTNNLIREGARIVTNINDITDEYDFKTDERDKISDLREHIVESVESGMFDIEEIIASTGFGIKEVNQELGKMQAEGVLERTESGEYKLLDCREERIKG